MIERLNVSERIIHMSSASVVSPGMEQRGEILVSCTAMYFVGEQVTIDMNQVREDCVWIVVVRVVVRVFVYSQWFSFFFLSVVVGDN